MPNQTHQVFKFMLLQNSTCVGHFMCPSSGCPKKLDSYNRINLDNWCFWLVIKRKFIAMNSNMNVKISLYFWCGGVISVGLD